MVLVQSFPYRGQPEEFSNKYHFPATPPSSDFNWKAMADNLITHLAPCFSVKTSFVRAYGYTDGSKPSVWSHDYTLPGPAGKGTYVPGSAPEASGDTAMMVYWPTVKRNTRGKIVYCRKYFHDVYLQPSPNNDSIASTQATALQTFATWIFQAASNDMGGLCLPDGTPALAGGPSGWATTRTLKRRGKRPPT